MSKTVKYPAIHIMSALVHPVDFLQAAKSVQTSEVWNSGLFNAARALLIIGPEYPSYPSYPDNTSASAMAEARKLGKMET